MRGGSGNTRAGWVYRSAAGTTTGGPIPQRPLPPSPARAPAPALAASSPAMKTASASCNALSIGLGAVIVPFTMAAIAVLLPVGWAFSAKER